MFLLFCFVCIWIDKFVFVFSKWLLLCRKSVFYLSSFRQVVETDQQKSDIISPVYERPKEYGVKEDRYHFPPNCCQFLSCDNVKRQYIVVEVDILDHSECFQNNDISVSISCL